jgi:hypothetical protein
MTDITEHPHRMNRFKARWPAWVALLALALLYEALPKYLYWGHRGWMIGVVILLLIPTIVTLWRGHLRVNRVLGLCINILITLYMIISVSRVVIAVFENLINAKQLLLSAMTLWGVNVLVFALWYWNLDAGGPHRRELREGSWFGAFLFPQMQIAAASDKSLPSSVKNWEPSFVDYLFLAFNTSTAFSPTDTAVLSRWAKLMSMIQAIISLTIVVMLAARAINIINA